MRFGTLAVTAALAAAACGAQISDGLVKPSAIDDAGLGGTGSGSDAAGGACSRRVVYLNFEGQTLTQTATSDATQNQASWMTIDQGTAPPYKDGNTDRDTTIQSIVDGMRSQLTAIPVTIVTTRPAAGPYVMIVFGGRASAVGSMFGAAVNTLDCGDLVPSDVAWIGDNVNPTQHVINTAIGAIGFGIGLTATADASDCMCGWANDCMSPSPDSDPCTLGSPIDRDPTASQLCPGTTSQDEVAALRNAFCR